MHRHRIRNILEIALCLALAIAIAQTSASPGVGQTASTQPQAKEPNVDYWQPLWMQREL